MAKARHLIGERKETYSARNIHWDNFKGIPYFCGICNRKAYLMKKALFFALILCTLSAYAQKKEAKSAKENYNYWEVKIPMLNLIDPFSPNIQAGIEHRFDTQFRFADRWC